MVKTILFLFLTIFCKYAITNDILFGITGLAKVGKSCFLSILIEDKSNLKIKELGLSMYSTNKDNLLIGRSKITLFKLNKIQPYTTSVPIDMENTELCNEIRYVNVIMNKCIPSIKKDISCKNLIKVNEKYKEDHSIMTRVLEDPSYYTFNSNPYFIKEFNVYLKVINASFAKKYNLIENTYGLIVTDIKGSSFFKKGDLIVEAEMESVKNIKQLKNQINIVFENKNNYILINFIRQNHKKLVAVKLK